jgi:hypothetical protein
MGHSTFAQSIKEMALAVTIMIEPAIIVEKPNDRGQGFGQLIQLVFQLVDFGIWVGR